jgi:ABC-2 type transport system ATP-binding protein
MLVASPISVAGLTKSYTETTGLFDLDLEAAAGSVTALLGPNGAGKTTAVRLLATLLKPDRGHIRIGGYDVVRQPREAQALISLTGQSASVDAKLTGKGNLAMFGRLHHLPWRTIRERSRLLLERFDLANAANKPVQSYSGGMRRKLDLAVSLIAEPSILFLDEPTTGLDPVSRVAVWEIIRELVAQGATVLLTTQYLDEADALADQIIFIDAGRRIAQGTPAELKAQAGQTQLRLTFRSTADAEMAKAALEESAAVRSGAVVQVPLPGRRDGLDALKAVIDAVGRSGVSPETYDVQEPTLNDVYFQLSGHQRPDEGAKENTTKEKT